MVGKEKKKKNHFHYNLFIRGKDDHLSLMVAQLSVKYDHMI